MTENVKTNMLSDDIAVITFDTPGNKVNLLSVSALKELDAALDELACLEGLKGIILASAKPGVFGAGADIKEIEAKQGDSVAVNEVIICGKRVFDKIAAFNCVAAINGLTLGGFCELVLACRYRLAAATAKLGLPEVKLGLIPGWGGCVRLPHLIDVEEAIKLITSGDPLPATEAWRLGLVDEIVEESRLVERAFAILNGEIPERANRGKGIAEKLKSTKVYGSGLKKIAAKMIMARTRGNYPAPLAALKVVLESKYGDRARAEAMETAAFLELAGSSVSANLVDIYMKQTAAKKSLSVADGASPPVTCLGVIGAGSMGAGIVLACLMAGYRVVLKEINPEALNVGVARIRAQIEKLVKIRKIKEERAEELFNNLTPVLEYADMTCCQLVIEAIFENMKVKKETRAALDAVMPGPYIFATNTSSLSVGEMAFEDKEAGIPEALYPDRIVGIHFFNPVHKMPLVEIVQANETSSITVDSARNFVVRLDKVPVECGDGPGFIVNRILVPYMREAILLAEQGVPFVDVDKAMKVFGMPMGPFELMDTVGLDIAGHVLDSIYQALGERFAPPARVAGLRALSLLGQKGGAGFYLYDDSGKTGPNPDAVALFSAMPVIKSALEIQDRLMLIMINEASRLLASGVAADADAIDLAMVFGTGFPPFRGGLLKYADAMGSIILEQKLSCLHAMHPEGNYEPSSIIKMLAGSRLSFYSAMSGFD